MTATIVISETPKTECIQNLMMQTYWASLRRWYYCFGRLWVNLN